MSARIRIVLADDHPIVLAGLMRLFSREEDVDVVASAGTGGEALRLVRELAPDILVLDLRMPETDGLDVLRAVHREGRATRTIVLTAVDGADVREAIRLGAHGVVLKDMATSLLVRCVREVHAGGRWLARDCATHTLERLLSREAGFQAVSDKLTPREMQVATMILEGMHNKAIARRMAITEGTAKLHLHHIYRKLAVDGRGGLMRYMYRNGLT